MFNKSFNNLTGNSLDFCPNDKLNAIDEINEVLKTFSSRKIILMFIVRGMVTKPLRA